MNQYPLWKYLLILFTLLAGLVYTLPNYFGEAPAVQIQAKYENIKVDDALLQRVLGVLGNAKLNADAATLEGNSIKVRFADTDTQLKAKDILQKELGDNYGAGLNLVPRSPQWMAGIHALPMYLGLDLRGGIHILTQVDMPSALTKTMEGYAGDLRQELHDKDIPYAGISRDGQVVAVRFRDAESRSKGEDIIKQRFNGLLLNGKEEGGEYLLLATLKQEEQVRVQDAALQQNLLTLRNRINNALASGTGLAEPIIQQQGADRIVIQVPGVQDPALIKELIGRTATLEVRMVDDEHPYAPGGVVPFGDEVFKDRDGSTLLVKKSVILTGERLTDAQPGFDGRTNEPAVHLTLDGVGAQKFKIATKENVGKRMAILLFEKENGVMKGEVVTAPRINEEIGGGRVQISGHMTSQEASKTALLLRSGALAAPVEIVEERTVGPSLGADNISRGFHSTWIGFAAITLFMIAYYMMFGTVSVLSLGTNLLLLVGALSVAQATLTLPGMAGIALTLGMAIDSNVLINERIREELRNGVSPQAAIHAGYDRAFGTILDSNVTTFIAGFALLVFGTGPVQGFAVVLCLGIATSMFSSVLVSRALVNLIYGRRARLAKVAIG
ncbi:MAG TPA: protein translocase subunit SecD [Gallionellaceae bacterium]